MGFMNARSISAVRVAPPAITLPASIEPPKLDTEFRTEQRAADLQYEAEQRKAAMEAAAADLRSRFPIEQANHLWGLVDGVVEDAEEVQPDPAARQRLEEKLRGVVKTAVAAVAGATSVLSAAKRVASVDVPAEVAMSVKKANADAAVALAAAIESEREESSMAQKFALKQAEKKAKREAEAKAEKDLDREIKAALSKSLNKHTREKKEQQQRAQEAMEEALQKLEKAKAKEMGEALESERAESKAAVKAVTDAAKKAHEELRGELDELARQAAEVIEALKTQIIEAREENERAMAAALEEKEAALRDAATEAQKVLETAVVAAIKAEDERNDAEHEEQLQILLSETKAKTEAAHESALSILKAEAASAATAAADEAASALAASQEETRVAEAQVAASAEAAEAASKAHADALRDAKAECHKAGYQEGMDAANATAKMTAEASVEGAVKMAVEVAIKANVDAAKQQLNKEAEAARVEAARLHESAMADLEAQWQARLDAKDMELAEAHKTTKEAHELTRSWVAAQEMTEAARIETVEALETATRELDSLSVRQLYAIRSAQWREEKHELMTRLLRKPRRRRRQDLESHVENAAAPPGDAMLSWLKMGTAYDATSLGHIGADSYAQALQTLGHVHGNDAKFATLDPASEADQAAKANAFFNLPKSA